MAVENLIIADPSTDPYPLPYTPDTHLFIPAPDWKDAFVEIGTKYDGVKFIHPAAAPTIKGIKTL